MKTKTNRNARLAATSTLTDHELTFATGGVSHGDFSITKLVDVSSPKIVDASSPKLFGAACKGTHIPVVLDLY